MLIDVRLAQAFVAVADAGSFVGAANRLHIGQSGLSNQIKRLEQITGTALFDRTSRSVRITDAGKRLYPVAQELLASAERFADAVHADTHQHVVSVAIAENGVNPIAIALLTAVRESVEDVDLELTRIGLDDQLDAFGAGADALIGRPPYGAVVPSKYRRARVTTDPLVVVASHDHEIGDGVTMDELAQLPRIVHAGVPSAWHEISPLLVAPPTSPDVVAVDSFRTACAQVRVSDRCCLMPESFARSYLVEGIRIVEVIDAPTMDVELVTGGDESHEVVERLMEISGTLAAFDPDRIRPLEERSA